MRSVMRQAARSGVRHQSLATRSQLGADLLSMAKLREQLPAAVWQSFEKSLQDGKNMDKATANAVAGAVKDWAISRGATTFAHVFYPATRPPALKYNTFINLNFGAEDWNYPLALLDDQFSGTAMLYGETDGSSFPNGGLRATHEAAAYLAWDRTSPMWIREDTLFIPAVFVTYYGHAQDEKTPLLRSQRAINDEGVRLMHLLGYPETKSVVTNVGVEQEFYLIAREHYAARPDLQMTGRTLVGAPATNNQQLSDKYFSEPSSRVKGFFKEYENECRKLGISYMVGHNEVGPSQHEWSPIFSLTNVAADQNNLAMRLMQDVAIRHGLVCLVHEKPFKGINGSGKHNNWGLNTNTGKNLYVAGENDKDEVMFMAMIATLARAIRKHGDILRLGVATPSNDHRLGAHEAPPAIISLYLGKTLSEFAEKAAEGGPLTGYTGAKVRSVDSKTSSVGTVPTGPEDRNRTAPFPWCSNRFEFRAVGSGQNISWALTCLHAAVAESMKALADDISGGKKVEDAIRTMLKANIGALFAGNNYAEEWHKEAEKRGLPHIRDTPNAVDILSDQKNIDLLSNVKVFTPEETQARQAVLYQHYTDTLTLEASTLIQMMNTALLPACGEDLLHSHKALVGDREQTYVKLQKATQKLQKQLDDLPEDPKKAAHYCADVIKPAMAGVRTIADQIEGIINRRFYPFPTYADILYSHHTLPEVVGGKF
jgi:glutamine synthetase